VFWSGRSQAVRLPKAYRVRSSVLLIRRDGDLLLLEPPEVSLDELGWPVGFWAHLGAVEDDFDLGDRRQALERPDPLRGR
jgi:antitoxin VapB